MCDEYNPAQTDDTIDSARAHLAHNRLLEHSPGVLQRLYRSFWFGRRPERFGDGGVCADPAPVFTRSASRLVARYSRFWIDRGRSQAKDLRAAMAPAV